MVIIDPSKKSFQYETKIPMDYTLSKVGLFLLAKERPASPMTILMANLSICVGMLSERGLKYSSLFSVHF